MDKAVFKRANNFLRLRRQFGGKRIGFQMTSACNSECSYCSVSAGKPADNELNTQEAKKLFVDLKELNVPVLFFTGGEPLLRDDDARPSLHPVHKCLSFCAARAERLN